MTNHYLSGLGRIVILFVSFFYADRSLAQQSALSCSMTSVPAINASPFTATTFTQANSSSGLASWGTFGSNLPANVIDNNLTNFARANIISGSATLSVTDAANTYNAGNFTGFAIKKSGLLNVSVLGNIVINTYSGGTLQESKTSAGLIGLALGTTDMYEIGFYARKPFNRVEITISSTLSVTDNYDVYYALFKGTGSCTSPAITACNQNTRLRFNTYPVVINPVRTGTTGIALASFTGIDNVVDSDTTNSAAVNMTLSVLGSAFLSVKNVVTGYPAGTYTGFDIENSSLLSLSVLGGYVLNTYRNDTLQETVTGAGLAVGATLLGAANRYTVGFVTTKAFDEVQIVMDQSLIGVSLGQTKIYSAVVKKLCAGPVLCNSSIKLIEPSYPVLVDGAKSGLACVACTIQNTPNVIDADTTNFAAINVPVGALSPVSIAVKDAATVYPSGAFAGFNIRSVNNPIQLGLISSVTITTFLAGNQQETKTGSNLLTLNLLLNVFGGGPVGRYNAGFITTLPFDEIQVSVSSLAGLVNTLEVYGAFVDTRTATGANLNCRVLRPDFNVALLNGKVSGNVSTNDNAMGYTYGTPVAGGSNPAGGTISMNPDGSYTFKGTAAGIYSYTVPVCFGSQTSGCESTPLTVTVNDPSVATNKPVLNPDVAIATGAPTTPAAIIVNVRANDGPGNSGGVLGLPTVLPPAHGTASVDVNGNVVYTPAAGYFGTDVVTYQVCEPLGGANCSSAQLTVNVVAAGTDLFAVSDDYLTTVGNAVPSVNILANDRGAGLAVSAINTTVTGKGTLTATGVAGEYTFTPVAGYSGTISFTYTVTDASGTTGNGTLYVLVKAFRLNPDFNVATTSKTIAGNIKTNDIVPQGTLYGTPVMQGVNPTATMPVLIPGTGAYTFVEATAGVYTFTIPVCPVGQTTGCLLSTLTITINNPVVATNKPVLNPDIAIATGAAVTPAPVTVNVKANDGPGNAGGVLGVPTVLPPANGTATVDSSGNIVYTPAAGYYGTDVVTYQVCENGTNCNTAALTVTVVAPDATDLLGATDDYLTTTGSNAATGNVLLNDKGAGQLTVVTPGTTNITGKGAFTVAANGAYSFVPAAGFTGSADFAYTATDTNGTLATATLHARAKEDAVYLNVKAFLQGAMSGSTMTTTLSAMTSFPKTQPYSAAPFNYTGTESVTVVPANVTDWILLELRDPANPATVLATRAGFLLNTGAIVATDGVSPVAFSGLVAGNYNVAVRHRNHLSIRTPAAQTIAPDQPLTYDFTTAQGQAYQNPAITTNPAMINIGAAGFAMFGGDATSNGVVRYNGAGNDRDYLFSAMGSTDFGTITNIYTNADVNMDGRIRYNGSNNDRDFIFTWLGADDFKRLNAHN